MKDYDNRHELWARAHAAGSPVKFVRNAKVFIELDKLVPGNTLDAGCGTGEYSKFLLDRGHEVTAFDPSPVVIKKLMEKDGKELGIAIEVNTIEGFSSSKMFDNIISIEVFEHIESDQTAIKKLYSLLKKGGSMVISVPATPFLYSKADTISGHYRRYSYEGFMKLLTDAGLRELRIKRYGFPVLFVYSLIRKIWLDKILINHFSSLSSSGSRKKALFLSKFYPFILAIDQLNIPFWSVGYVARCKK